MLEQGHKIMPSPIVDTRIHMDMTDDNDEQALKAKISQVVQNKISTADF